MPRDILNMLGSKTTTTSSKVTKPVHKRHDVAKPLNLGGVQSLFNKRWTIGRGVPIICNQPDPKQCLAAVADATSKQIKIALFDLDYTLVKTLTGARFPCDKEDWRWWNLGVAKRLNEIAKEYLVVIFTNQGAVVARKDAKLYTKFTQRVNGVVAATKLTEQVVVYAAPKNPDKLTRKPEIGMWTALEQFVAENGYSIDKLRLYFVGDAAGRQGDHSDSDKVFAENVGIAFRTPEEEFTAQDP